MTIDQPKRPNGSPGAVEAKANSEPVKDGFRTSLRAVDNLLTSCKGKGVEVGRKSLTQHDGVRTPPSGRVAEGT